MRFELHANRALPAGRDAVDAFVRGPSTWLPHGSRGRLFGWVVQLEAVGVTRVVLCLGSVCIHGDATWRSLHWEPLEDDRELLPMGRLLPAFTGELGVTSDQRRRHQLELHGTYTPPRGVLGGAVDQAGMHRVAQAMADRLLMQIAERLASPTTQVARGALAEGPVPVGTHGPRPGVPGP